MKITPAHPDAQQSPTKLPGVELRDTPQGLVVQGQRRGMPLTIGTKRWQWSMRWKFAGIMSTHMVPLEAVTAIELSKGTEQVPRDVATMACLGRYYVIEGPDGFPMRAIREPTVTDPDAHRQAALTVQNGDLPWQHFYLDIGNKRRLEI